MHKTDLNYRILGDRMSIISKGKCEKLLNKMGEWARNVHLWYLSQVKYVPVLQYEV